MLKPTEKMLLLCTDSEVQEYTESIGYTFTAEDCEALREESHWSEMMVDAVSDYLDAYER